MKIIIAGSRHLDPLKFINEERRAQKTNNLFFLIGTLLGNLEAETGRATSEIVSGGARGIDLVGEAYAHRYGIAVKQFIPDWSKGRAAGHERNGLMADYTDGAVIIWDGKSRGSKNMLEHMHRLGKPVAVHEMEKL